MRFLAELAALLFALGIRHIRSVFLALAGITYSLIMLTLFSKHGNGPVPFPWALVLIITIYFVWRFRR